MKELEVQASVKKIEFLQRYGPCFRRLAFEDIIDLEVLF
jgi:hypothetical protein